MDHYCVVGNPIEHSLSPFIHNYFAKNTSQNLEYGRQLIELDKFKETVVGLFKDGLCGCNVTVPFKEQAYDMCDKLTPRAELAQSVNTLMMCDGIIYGDNTDGAGIVKDLMDNQNVVIKDRDILVIGAGGAAKGIIGSLLEQSPRKLVITNRTSSKSVLLSKHFARWGNVAADTIDCVHGVFDIVINATSGSLKGELPGVPDSVFNRGTVAYDLMYSTKPTVFMEHADALGAVAYDGLGMLIEQAAESFNFWRKIMPDTKELIKVIRSMNK